MTYVGNRLYTVAGKELGTITDVIARPSDLQPEWVAIKRGLLRREHLIPVTAIDERGGLLVTALDERTIKEAPVTHDHNPPNALETERLRAHFGLEDGVRDQFGGSRDQFGTSSAPPDFGTSAIGDDVTRESQRPFPLDDERL